MSEFRPIFCKEAEYRKHLSNRIHEDRATVGSLYTGMFTLGSNPNNFEAMKLPLRLLESTPREIGGRTLLLAILDVDLQISHTEEFPVSDGKFVDIYHRHSVIDDTRNITYEILEGYMKKYGDEMDDSLNDILADIRVPQKELVTA